MSQVEGAPVASWPPESATVARAADGDEVALTTIIEGGYPRLLGFLSAAGAEDPEDLAADVIVSVITHLPRLRSVEAFEGWFWTIALSRFRTWLRRRRRPPRPDLPSGVPTEPPELAETADEHSQIRAALATLAPQDRALLWLREVEGSATPRSAGVLGPRRARCGWRSIAPAASSRRRTGAALPGDDDDPPGRGSVKSEPEDVGDTSHFALIEVQNTRGTESFSPALSAPPDGSGP